MNFADATGGGTPLNIEAQAKRDAAHPHRLRLAAPPIKGRDHARGSSQAEVTLLEYGDHESPHCGCAHRVVKRLQEYLGGEHLRFVFRHFPVTQICTRAFAAAQAAEAAGMQGRFWEMHDLLFARQGRLDDESLARYADELDLDVARFVRELAAGAHRRRIEEDFTGGIECGVKATPTFFINGVRHDDHYDFETLLAAIEEAGAAAFDTRERTARITQSRNGSALRRL